MGKKRQMKNPILEHVNLFAKGLIVTVGIFVLTIFISGFYEKYLLNIMPVCVTWIFAVFTILWQFIGLTITLMKSIKFIIKNILLADLSEYNSLVPVKYAFDKFQIFDGKKKKVTGFHCL